jgi:hypothetical protein
MLIIIKDDCHVALKPRTAITIYTDPDTAKRQQYSVYLSSRIIFESDCVHKVIQG